MTTKRHLTLTNWGAYEVETDGHDITAVHPFAKDPDPSPIGQSLKAVRRSRVMRPSIRESWYRNGPGSNTDRRGHEPFVEVEWDVALEMLAAEIDRVRSEYGNEAIFGGSYGWASAGRFHHALSQIHRFLGSIGGYVSQVDDYSIAAGHVITPHVLGFSFDTMMDEAQPHFPEIAEHSELVVSFGGMPIKNSQVMYGGQGRHMLASRLELCHDRGVSFVSLSPLREDMIGAVDAEWIPMLPSTDTAVMLGLAHSLLVAGDHDEGFLNTYCTGWEALRAYLLGESDGVPKTAVWAGAISSVDPGRIRSLASQMARKRTLVTASWSVQRTDHGEQTYWMASSLAAMLGQIGLPGGGVGFGYGAVGYTGNGIGYHELPRLDSGRNDVTEYIPVARIADMLLSGGEEYDYNGKRLTYPDIHMVYWAGGNPFHHHQDLNRLAKAWQNPDTIVAHEPFWNALARHSDIVLPATTTLERNDIGGSGMDDFLFWMEKVIDPVGEARDDYDIFSALAERLGSGDRFSEGRTTDEWIEYMYERFHSRHGEYPDLAELRDLGFFQIPERWISAPKSLLVSFREDPIGAALGTPSGRIELFSNTVASFGYADCPGHPTWIEPGEWPGNASSYPLSLISNQPKTRLHSQWDQGETSIEAKVDGREQLGITPEDATARDLEPGDLVRVFNDRGACLAAVAIRHDLIDGVVQLPTGAWWDPIEPGGMCRSGNPNVLTHDRGTSSMARGPSTSCLVEVEKYTGEPPAVRAHDTPILLEAH
jgi:biotin/methionine sulfoxide reductase